MLISTCSQKSLPIFYSEKDMGQLPTAGSPQVRLHSGAEE
jgi:hypothetical protein